MSNLLLIFVLPSVFFRVNPWLILLLLPMLILNSVANSSANSYSSFREIPCSSVANASASFRVSVSVFSVFFREIPWQILLLLLFLPPWLIVCLLVQPFV